MRTRLLLGMHVETVRCPSCGFMVLADQLGDHERGRCPGAPIGR
jgi:hypothetical protein